MHSAKLFSAAFAGLSLLSIAVAAPQLGRSKLPKTDVIEDGPLKIRGDGWDIAGDVPLKIRDDGEEIGSGLLYCCNSDKDKIPDDSVCDPDCSS